MKLLLTSAGIKNTTIHEALAGLLGKRVAESDALCIPTATYAFPGGAGSAWRLISGRAATADHVGGGHVLGHAIHLDSVRWEIVVHGEVNRHVAAIPAAIDVGESDLMKGRHLGPV